MLLLVVAAAAITACDRIVDLRPRSDARVPDAAPGNPDARDGGIGDAGNDGGISDGGGALPDAFVGD